MKIGIIGTRGIPNRYGGFEELAEHLAVALVHAGHQVAVYNPSFHPYSENHYKGVEIIRKTDPNMLGSFSQFIYDLLCILDTRDRGFNVIIQLGYTSSSVWHFLLPRKSKLITNMDGLEWKRSKYSKPVRAFLQYAEALAVKHGGTLVADSPVIHEYLRKKYEKLSAYIPYAAEVFFNPDPRALRDYGVEAENYYLLIARFEPENHIETIIQGYLLGSTDAPLLLIGNWDNAYGKKLRKKYASERIIYAHSVYNKKHTNNLRYYSKLYFHGHSVGGTNPSLLEAMACSAKICAHKNPFNQYVLGENAFYFSNPEDISGIIQSIETRNAGAEFINPNLQRIETEYAWDRIIEGYERLIRSNF